MLFTLLIMGCGDDKTQDPTDTAVLADVTWHQGIHKLVSENCQRCHSSEDSLTFPLEDYEFVKSMASLMLDKVQGSETPPFMMPPFNAVESDSCTPPVAWKHDPRLSDEQIQLLSDWIAADYPLGDEASAYEIESNTGAELTGDNIQTLTSVGHTISEGESEDQYRCFSLDPGLSDTQWITGLEVLADNKDIVHHVVIFSDPTGASASMVDQNGSYDCYGSAGVPDSGVLFAWAPGGEPMLMPENSGFEVKPGARLVAQMHYHPLYGAEGDSVDQSALKVQWQTSAPERGVLYEVFGGVFENDANSTKWDDPPFEVPAGAANHTEVWREPLTIVPDGSDVRIFGIFPHMHMLGRDIRISVQHADGSETCVAHVPQYDFEWQLTYLYDAPIAELPKLEPTDTLVIECTYDNSESNPFFQEYLSNAGLEGPMDVGVGENTLDEMCTGILGIVF